MPFLTSGSSTSSFSSSLGLTGHSLSEKRRKAGPDAHVLFLRNMLTVDPLEATSAGLLAVCTYLHYVACEALGISVTRVATNIRNREVSFLIYLRTEALSIQKIES